MRTLTVAALLVLLLAPEAVVHPSFQMSFAATLALIAGYERGAFRIKARRRQFARRPRRAVGRQRDRRPDRWLRCSPASPPRLMPPITSIASRPMACIANLLAMPVVSAWVMPMGIFGIVAMPFGFDAECWRQMGYGIEWMDAVALWVASLPGRLRPRDALRRRTAAARHARVSC